MPASKLEKLKKPSPIIIVGAGWAGLTAALSLTRAGHEVTVLEAAPQIGGRARAISFGEHTVDNGQHLFMGAYQNILTILDWLNIPEEKIFHRMPLALSLFGHTSYSAYQSLALRLSNLPKPFHLLMALLTAKGLSLSERLKTMQFFRSIKANDFHLPQDISILNLLQYYHQPHTLIQKLWEPIALAAMSTPLSEASAKVFLTVLKKTFFGLNLGLKKHSDWLFPKADLSEVLPNPVMAYLNQHEKKIFYHQRAQALIFENGQCIGVKTNNTIFKGQAVILATPPSVTAQLLFPHVESNSNGLSLYQNLQKFHYQPITTVYLRYAKPIDLKYPMIGLINRTGQWVFDRKMAGQANILSVVISGRGVHNQMEQSALIKQISQELKIMAPQFTSADSSVALSLQEGPIESRVVTEKRAAFSCDVGIEHYRPSHKTPFANLWLTGDYTQKGYPATLESAVQSGMEVAKLILCDLSNNNGPVH
jgi:squalene-associated FAD-dependent desaturase